jgi:cytoskeletal protein CcmA (bactofilin family)
MFTAITDDRGNHLTAAFYAMLNVLLFAALLLAIGPASAQETEIEAGDDDSAAPTLLIIGSDEELPEPIAGFATRTDDKVVVEDTVTDLFAAGQEVTIRGTVLDNAFAAGQTVTLDGGRVEGDLFVAAGMVLIDGEILGDLYGFSGDLHITPRAMIHGDVRIGVGDLTHEGAIGGMLDAAAGMAKIDGKIDGDAKLEVGELELGPKAIVGGDLIYEAPLSTEILDPTQIAGVVDFTQVEASDAEGDDEGPSVMGWLLKRAWLYFGALIVGCVLLRISGRRFGRFADALIEQPGRSVGIGFVSLVSIPAFAVLAMVLVLPLQLGVLTTLLYLVALYVAGIIASLAIGRWILNRMGRTEASAYAALALGLLALHLLLPVPFLGFVVRLVAVVAGLGAMWVAARNGHTEEPVL